MTIMYRCPGCAEWHYGLCRFCEPSKAFRDEQRFKIIRVSVIVLTVLALISAGFA